MCLRMLLLPKANAFTVVTVNCRKLRQRHKFICSMQAEMALKRVLLKTQGGFLHHLS